MVTRTAIVAVIPKKDKFPPMLFYHVFKLDLYDVYIAGMCVQIEF